MEWARVIASGDTFDVSFRIRRFDGVYRWFKTRAVPLRDPAGRILKWFGSNTDIEDFVLAERKLKVQLERMQLLDRTTHAIGIAPGAAQGVRGGAAQPRRQPRHRFRLRLPLPGRARSAHGRAAWASAARSWAGRSGIVEQAQHRSGRERPEPLRARRARVRAQHRSAHASRFPARLATGGLRALVAAPLLDRERSVRRAGRRRDAQPNAFSSDDCEFLRQLSSHVALAAHQARLYGALQDAYQDLRQTQQTVMQQERLRALGQIASGIAHDINNALSPAALYAQSMLTHEAGLSSRSREQLGVIQRAIDDVARTVQRMRAFYLPRGLELTLAPVDVNQIAHAGHRPHARALEQHAAGTRRRGAASRRRSRARPAEDPRRRKRSCATR